MAHDTYWLNLTNAALGIVTGICLFVFVRAIIAELVARAKSRAPLDKLEDQLRRTR